MHGRHVSPGGAAVGNEAVVNGDVRHQYGCDAVSNGRHTLVAWTSAEVNEYAPIICADTVGRWQDHFWSQSEFATAFNQGRSLARDPEVGTLHMVFMSGDSVFYSYSTDDGDHWVPYEFVVSGMYPSIACVPEGPSLPGRVWISYTTGRGIYCMARLGLCQWRQFTVRTTFDEDPSPGLGAPSMGVGFTVSGQTEFHGVYVAYVVPTAQGSSVECRAVDFDRGIVDQSVVDGTDPAVKRAPSIAATPGDVVSVVWQRDDGLGQRVYCRNRYYGQWGSPVPVSYHFLVPNAEPAWEQCVEAYGDSAYVVWRGRGQSGAAEGDVWRRSLSLDPVPQMPFEPWDVSNSEELPSEYPQNSLDVVAAWQERYQPAPPTWDIRANVAGEPWVLWHDVFSANHPDVVADWDGSHGVLYVNTLWTNVSHSGGLAPYEVVFRQDEWLPHDAPLDFDFYDCGVGDSVQSRYCVSRDGWAKWRDYRVDFGREALRYRLPYLNPGRVYKLRVVLFQASRDTWVQDFSMEGRHVVRVPFRPLVPETVWVTIPRESYRSDCEVTFDVGRVTGKHAAVAELRLYQRDPCREGKDGGVQSASTVPPPGPGPLDVTGASLSRREVMLSYSCAALEQTDLCIYDSRGVLVRTLVSGQSGPGRHAVRWDGTDAAGARVPAGTYFCRLVLGGTGHVRKAILTQ